MRFGSIRLHYLLAYAIVGAYMPYLPVFLGRDLGMPDWQIGWIAGMYGMAVILSPPIVTYLADRRFSGRTLIGLAYALTGCALLALAFASGFVAVLLISVAFSMVYTPMFALLDGLTFSASAAARHDGLPVPPYDRIRVWGSLGFMIPAFVLFFALRAGAASGRAAIFAAAVAAGLGLLCIPLLPRIAPGSGKLAARTPVPETNLTGGPIPDPGAPVPADSPIPGAPVPTDSPTAGAPVPKTSLTALVLDPGAPVPTDSLTGSGVPVPADSSPDAAAWHVLRRAPTRDLLIPLGLLFASIAVFYGFYARLVLEVGIDPSWVGLVMNIGVLSELPFMFAAGPLLRRFSLRSLIIFGAACLVVRMLLLATIADPRVTVASQLLHGPVVVAIYLIPPMYLNLKAPANARNSVQGFYAMICFGVARLLGSVAGGYAAGLGLAWAFGLGAVLAAAALVWLWLRFFDPAADAALRSPLSRP